MEARAWRPIGALCKAPPTHLSRRFKVEQREILGTGWDSVSPTWRSARRFLMMRKTGRPSRAEAVAGHLIIFSSVMRRGEPGEALAALGQDAIDCGDVNWATQTADSVA